MKKTLTTLAFILTILIGGCSDTIKDIYYLYKDTLQENELTKKFITKRELVKVIDKTVAKRHEPKATCEYLRDQLNHESDSKDYTCLRIQ